MALKILGLPRSNLAQDYSMILNERNNEAETGHKWVPPGMKAQVKAATEIHKAGAQLLSRHTHLSQHIWPTLTTPARAPSTPQSLLDWLNWLKMTPIIGSRWGFERPNDPYLHIP